MIKDTREQCSSCEGYYEDLHYFQGGKYCEVCISEIDAFIEMTEKWERPVRGAYNKLFPQTDEHQE